VVTGDWLVTSFSRADRCSPVTWLCRKVHDPVFPFQIPKRLDNNEGNVSTKATSESLAHCTLSHTTPHHITTMLRERIFFLLHPRKRRTVAPLPLLEAIPVEEAEVAAVLAEFRREAEMPSTPITTSFNNARVLEPPMAQVIILDF
jgi:hypothetical protein